MHNQMIRGHSMWPCIIQGVLNRRFKRVFAYFCRAATIIHDRIERSRIIDCSRPLDVAVNNLSRQKRA